MLLAILLDRFRQEVNYKNMPFGATLTQMTIRFHSVGNGLVEICYLKGRIMVVPIGKSNCYLDAEKSHSNPIYKITVDILKQTNFFRAITGGYKCQLDEQWFNLTKDTLRDALRITPVNNNKAFSSPPTQDTLINFVNDLGYPKEVKHLSNVVTNDMFQPWRTLTTIINLCLTGKTSGFERPRAPVLQILWGIINRAHIDYAERMWEEFTQSIHTFTEDKKNLAQHTQGKKKATLIMIPSVRFTKLIIFHLQCKHKFHPRPESPLHLPTEEPILLQAKPVAPKAATKKPQPAPTKPKEKKRKQAKETSEATPPAKRAKAGKVVKKRTLKRSQQLFDEFVDEGIPLTEPGFGDLEADTQRAIEESLKDAQGAPRGPFPPVVFRETDTGKFQPLPEVEGKGKEKVGAEQAAQVLLNLQTPKKKCPAEQYIFQRRTSAPTEPSGHDESPSLYVELGLTESDIESDEEMPLVVKSGDQDEGQARPDPGIQDKGQAEPNPDDVAESQPLSTPGVHAGPNLEHTDAEATDATSQPQPGQMDEEFTTTTYYNVQENLKLMVNEPVIPEEPARSTRTLSPLQHLAKDFSFGDQFFNDKPSEADNEKTTADIEAESMVSVTIHQDTSAIPPMTSPVIDLVSRPDSPNVHRPLPTTATATATTITTIKTLPLPPQPQQGPSYPSLLKHIGELEQHIADLVDANQALEERLDKHGSRLYRLENQDIPNQLRKAMDGIVTDAVDWAIQTPLRERFRDLPEADMKEILHNRMWESKSYQTHEDHMMLYEALEKSMARDNCDQLLSDLAEATKKKKKRQGSPKTPPGSPPHPPPPPPPAGPSGTSGASGASGSSQSPPPPPPLSNNQGGQFTSTAAPSSSKIVASAEYTAWMTTDTRIKPSVSPIPEELHMDDDTTADEQAYSSSGEDVGRDHIPTVNLRQSWWKPLTEDRPATPEPAWSIPSSALTVPTNNWASALKSTYTPPPENSLLAQIGDMATFMDWYCKKQGISELTQKDLEGPAYEIVKVFHPDVVHLQFQMEECHKLLTDQVDDAILRYNVSKPLPLGGDPGHVTIQPDFFFNKDLEYLRYGRKMGRPALSISKMKAAYYPDVGLEQMVPDQMWIEEECKYDVAAMYGISHWWFQRQRFYIDRHTSEGDRRAVRTHMRILSVVRIEVFSMYGYNYMKKIVLRRADLKEYVIAERDFKYLYPSDFEDLYLLNLQGHLNHLSPKDKKILNTAVNLWTRNLVIRQRVEDFWMGIESYQTQAVTFSDKYGVQMIMRFNEIHKFSDGTLQQIDEALDYRVKEFRVNMMNPGLDTRFWAKKDVDRSKEFMVERSNAIIELESEWSRLGKPVATTATDAGVWSNHIRFTSHNVLGIALVAIIDRQLPFEYTITSRSTDVVVMALPVHNINHSAFRSMFEREKLSGNNFNDWFRQLKLVLRVEKKMYVIEQPLPAAPAANSEANVLLEWNAIYDAYNEVACLILSKDGKPVAAYVIQMKGYADQLERLGYVLPQEIIVGLILNGLTKDFSRFVRNYNMHNMGKTVGELHAMLIEYEKGLPKKAETPQIMMIKGGKIQKANKKSLKAKGKGKANGKGKNKKVYIPNVIPLV
ncbi:hypothetical protein Tco_0893027 [Tanacetum coccineum]|uniref:Uncharacterized protein n=1 Tax=Tanacetum coccineum TaxID=301880 RepID=A0ABQ5C7Y6_9ASTR